MSRINQGLRAVALIISLACTPAVLAQNIQLGPKTPGSTSCRDINDITCINAGSVAKGATDTDKPASKEKAKGEIDKYRSNMNDSTEVDGILRATTFCLGPNGERIPNKGSIELYFFNKSANCERDKETRICAAGILSGSASFAACQPFANCSGPGYALNHGQSGTFSNAPRAVSCQTALRTCNDGTLTGNTSLSYAGTCTPFRNCTHQGVNIAHGASATFYRVNVSTNCSAEQTSVSCNDGTVSGGNLTYSQRNCSAPANCTHQGVSINHGQSATFYRVDVSSNCASEQTTVTCNNGSVTGSNLSYAQRTCVAPPANCTFQGVSILHGQSRVFYRTPTSTSCPSEGSPISCNNGVLSGQTSTHRSPSCSTPIVTPPSGDTNPVCSGDVIHPISLIDAQDGIGVEVPVYGFHSTALNKTFLTSFRSSYGYSLPMTVAQTSSAYHFSRLRSGSANSNFAGPPPSPSQLSEANASIMFPGAPITGLEVFKHSGFAGYSGANAAAVIQRLSEFQSTDMKSLVSQYRSQCTAATPTQARTAKMYCGWYAHYDDIGLGSGAGSMKEGYCTFVNHYTSAKYNWVPEPTCKGPSETYIYSWNAGMCNFALSYRTALGGGYASMFDSGQAKVITRGFTPGNYYELSTLPQAGMEFKQSSTNKGCRLDATPTGQQYIMSGEGQGPIARQGEYLELTCDMDHVDQIKRAVGQRITAP